MKIKIVVYEPGKQPEERNVSRSLKTLKQLVGGYLKAIRFRQPGTQHLVLVCNDEGQLLGLPENRGLAGTWFVCRDEGANFGSLTEQDLAIVRNLNQFAP